MLKKIEEIHLIIKYLTALLCLITFAMGHAASVADNTKEGKEFLEKNAETIKLFDDNNFKLVKRHGTGNRVSDKVIKFNLVASGIVKNKNRIVEQYENFRAKKANRKKCFKPRHVESIVVRGNVITPVITGGKRFIKFKWVLIADYFSATGKLKKFNISNMQFDIAPELFYAEAVYFSQNE